MILNILFKKKQTQIHLKEGVNLSLVDKNI